MMRPRSSHRHSQAFTIVELLVVIVVIAILAAISVVAYNGVQNRARAAAASLALNQVSKKIALSDTPTPTCAQFYTIVTTKTDTTSCLFTDSNITYEYKQTPNSASPTGYCITASSGNVSQNITSNGTLAPNSCSGHGSGGIPAITNLILNPRAASYTSTGPGWATGRWAGSSPAAANYTTVTGASDGPIGITSYARKTWTTAPAAITNSGDTGYGGGATIDVTPGEAFTISCYLRPSVIRNINIDVYQYNSAGTFVSRSPGSGVTGPANQWTRLNYTYTVPSGVGKISFVCDSNSSGANSAANWAVGSRLDGTGFMVTRGTSLYNFADGDSPGWDWNGTAGNASSSGTSL